MFAFMENILMYNRKKRIQIVLLLNTSKNVDENKKKEFVLEDIEDIHLSIISPVCLPIASSNRRISFHCS